MPIIRVLLHSFIVCRFKTEILITIYIDFMSPPPNRGSLCCSTSNVVIVIIALNKNINRAVYIYSLEFRVSRQISPVTYKIHLAFWFFTLYMLAPFFFFLFQTFVYVRREWTFSLLYSKYRILEELFEIRMRVVETINMYTITNAKNISTKSRSYPLVRIIFLHETKKNK